MSERPRPKITVDEERILETVSLALRARAQREGIFAAGIQPPEKVFVELAKTYGQEIGSEVFALHALFFLTPTIFASNSDRQFARAANPETFKPYAWLFDPNEVLTHPPEEVRQAAIAFLKPSYNKIAIEKWQHNASVLVKKYQSNLGTFFAEYNNDAPAIVEALVGPERKINWEGFHRFGPKLARLFLQWVNQYELAKFERIKEIGIPVDFQVTRLAIQTGGLGLDQPTHRRLIQDEILTPLLTKLVREKNLNPQEVSETLWLIGNKCCNNLRHDLCPLTELCDRLISREPFDRAGLLDPKDTGRWETRGSRQAQQARLKETAAGQTEFPIA